MKNNPEPIKEILDELFSLLETLETQSLALTQFLKDQGIATEEKLAPYVDRAGNASSVKWRAARARMQYLLSPVAKKTDDQEKDKNQASEKPPAEKSSTEKPSVAKQSAENLPSGQNEPESNDAARDAARNASANVDKNRKPAAPKPVTEDDAKKSDTRQKSNSE
jgi:hypothetical protein